MSLRFKETKKEHEWESGNASYKIRHGLRYRSTDTVIPKRVSDLGPDIFHCYHKGQYIAQRHKLEDAKKACIEHKDKNS